MLKSITEDNRYLEMPECKMMELIAKHRLRRSVGKVKIWLQVNQNRMPLKDIWRRISQMLTGHYGYYGVSGNYTRIKQFHYLVERLLFKWLNRRSQRKGFIWEQFSIYEGKFPLPKPRVYHKLYLTSLIYVAPRLSEGASPQGDAIPLLDQFEQKFFVSYPFSKHTMYFIRNWLVF